MPCVGRADERRIAALLRTFSCGSLVAVEHEECLLSIPIDGVGIGIAGALAYGEA